MADNNPKPPPKPPTRPLDDKMKDLDAQDRMDNFEIQRLMSHETSDPQEGGEIVDDPDGGGEVSSLIGASLPIEANIDTAFEAIDDDATKDLRDLVGRVEDNRQAK